MKHALPWGLVLIFIAMLALLLAVPLLIVWT